MEETRILEGTVLSFAYALLHSPSDQKIVTTFNWLVIGATVFTIVWNLVGTFAYGKAAVTATGTRSSFILRRLGEYPISSRFTWRYGFIPTVVVPWVVISCTPSLYLFNLSNFAALAIFYVHYFNRSLIYSSKISDKATPSPLWFFLTVFSLTTVLTFVQAHYLVNILKPESSSFVTFFGITMSVLGSILNNHHDNLLTKLKARGEGYQIPKESLFEFVSCANYFGEILEWWGFALVTSMGSPQVAFASFSTVFLVLRARFVHKWYLTTFGSKYPRSRKAIIPFIY